MVRLISLLVIAIVLVLGGVWVANQQGTVSIHWWFIDVDTSMFVALFVLLLALVALYLIAKAVSALSEAMGFGPGAAKGRLKHALRGLSEAYGGLRNDNPALARTEARRASNVLGGDGPVYPGALMEADGLARMGRTTEARVLYKALLGDRDAEAGAIRGLLELATKEGNEAEMKEWLERALFKVDNPAWAARPAIELAKRGHEVNLERAVQVAEKNGEISPAEAKALKVEAFVAQSKAAQKAGKTGEAVKLAQKALAVDAASTEAAVHGASVLMADGKGKKAEQVIEEAWRAAPSAALGAAWMDMAAEKGGTAGLNRAQALAAANPHHAESRLLVAEAAIGASMWGQARSQLEPLTGGDEPSARACALMADLEKGEKNNADAAATWMRRALEVGGLVSAKAA